MNKADNFIINRICKAILDAINGANYEVENDRVLNNFLQVSGTNYGFAYFIPYFTANDIKVEEDKGWVYINLVSDNLQVEKFKVGVAYDEDNKEVKQMVEDSLYKVDKIQPVQGKVFKFMKFHITSRKVVILPDTSDSETLTYKHTKNPIPVDNLSMVLSRVLPSKIRIDWTSPIYRFFVYKLEYWVSIKFSKR